MIKVKIFSIVLITSLFSVLSMGQTFENSAPITKNTTVFDYSNLSWVDAFDSLHACMSLRYPFTEWKAIDWTEKTTVARPSIEDAQNNGDTIAFIQHMFEYLYHIPDGHIELTGVSDTYKHQVIGGSYGFNMMKIDDGSVVVTYIPEESPAYIAGLRTNDRILKWNDVQIDDVGSREYLNYFRNYATEEGRSFSRYLMLARDSVGSISEITYQNHQTKEESTISLIAFNDSMELFYVGIFNTAQPPNMDSLVYYSVLESGVGYLFIGAETCEGITPEEIMQCPDFLIVQEAVSYFNDNNIDKLIVDLRFNLGGNDLQASIMMGLFYEGEAFYEHITGSYDNDYEVIYTLYTEPLTPVYNGQIAVIVDPNCISTGEGLAMMFDRLSNATLISHWGTNGSFGIVDYDPIIMPTGLQVTFPQARSLDENYTIQIDSDSLLVGGVSPTEVVPLTNLNVHNQWVDMVDVQLQYAEITLISGVTENSLNKYKLYPNPCSRRTNLKFDSKLVTNCELKIFDVNGCLVHKELLELGRSNYSIELNDISSSIYFYELKNDSKINNGKIVVSK